MKSDKINTKELFKSIDDIYEEKGITKEYLIDALKSALVASYKKDFELKHNGSPEDRQENDDTQKVTVPEDVEVEISEKEIKVYVLKEVVSKKDMTPQDIGVKITLEDAKKISKKAKIGDKIKVEVTPANFYRKAASSAKQILVQKIVEAEKDLVYTQYADKVGQIVTGTVQKTENFGVIVDLGKVEALIPKREEIRGEVLEPHQQIRALVLSVENKTGKSSLEITLSRKSPEFVKKLFENEVPELMDGTVEIKGIAREAGSRTKIAVWSNDENVDPVGSLVGKKGMRIQPIINELNGEKIDVIPYSEDIPSYIINAISPAPILAIDINDEEKIATVVVPDDALVFAIGAGGQNVRLAAILTGWKIDIKTETQVKEPVVDPTVE